MSCALRKKGGGYRGGSYQAILLTGVTASRKSDLAVRLARRLDGEIVNADAMQCYAAAPTLTNRPGVEDFEGMPNHLFGFLKSKQRGSVGHWLEQVRGLLARGALKGVPIFVGGSGLYLESLYAGLAPLPPIPQKVHAHYAALRIREGRAGLLQRLETRASPEDFARLKARDPQRLQRALEVMATTGRTMSEIFAQERPALFARKSLLRIVNAVPRETSLKAIARRADLMLSRGALKEARELSAFGLDHRDPLARAIGVRELQAHLSGQISLEAAKQDMIYATRRYAKRQRTWFRNRFSDWMWLHEGDVETRCAAIVERFAEKARHPER